MRFYENLAGLDAPIADKVMPMRGDVGIGQFAALQYEPNRLALWNGTGPFAGIYEGKTTVGVPTTPIIYPRAILLARPGDVYLAQLRASGLAITAATATSVTFPALDPQMTGAFVYVFSGTGIGQLRRIISVASNVGTLSRPWSIVPTATSTVQLIRPVFVRTPIHASGIVAALSPVAVPEVNPRILEQYIQQGYGELEPMRAAQHENLDNLHLPVGGVKFFYKIRFDA